MGQRTREPETLKELVEGKFVDALRTVAAEITMEELHVNRGDKVNRGRARAAADLLRNDVQVTIIQVRNKNLETERQALDIARELEYARLAQERELEMQRASQRADVARQRAEQEQEAERGQIGAREAGDRARISSERAVEEERIGKEREVEQLEIARRQAVELAEQHRAIAVAEQSKAQSEAQGA